MMAEKQEETAGSILAQLLMTNDEKEKKRLDKRMKDSMRKKAEDEGVKISFPEDE